MVLYICLKYATKKVAAMNSRLLRAKMVENGLSQKQCAAMIGISENSLCRKCIGKRKFNIEEVAKLCAILNISDPRPIFFDSDSQI